MFSFTRGKVYLLRDVARGGVGKGRGGDDKRCSRVIRRGSSSQKGRGEEGTDLSGFCTDGKHRAQNKTNRSDK